MTQDFKLRTTNTHVASICTLALSLLATDAQAVEFNFSGFASLSAGRTNSADEKLIDYGQNWSARSDTVLGLQLDAQINNKFSIMGQVVSRGFSYDDKDDYELTTDWLTLNYQIDSNKRVRIGRVQSPLFLYSDTLEIGYSYVWARPPIDVYMPILGFIHSVDGIDFTYAPYTQWGDLSVSVFAGETDGVYNNSIVTEAQPIVGLEITLDRQDIMFRYALQGMSLTQSSSFGQIGNGFLALSGIDPLFTELANSFELEDGWYQYHSLGAQAFKDDWTFVAEMNGTVAPEKDLNIRFFGTYFSASLTGEVFTPYGVLGYSRLRPNSELSELLTRSETIVPTGINPMLDVLRNVAMSSVNSLYVSSYSTTLGVRMDFHPQWALKAEIQYFTGGTALIVGDLTVDRDKDVILATLVLDTVF